MAATTPAIVSVASVVSRVDACALCSLGPEALSTAVVVRNASGATIEFLACERCTAAVRRLIAAAGGASATGPAQMAFVTESTTLHTAVDVVKHDTVGAPVLVHEFAEPFVAPDNVVYIVRVWGQARSDGTWIGWLTFVSPEARLTRRTPRETSQSTREHLAYWATGLEGSYLEGAFGRAT